MYKRDRIDYWKNIESVPKSTSKDELYKYQIRDNDAARFYFYQWYLGLLGKDTDKIPISADLLNDMDEWYLDLAQAKIEGMQTDLITKEQWIELCKKYDKWCDFCEVSDCTYEQAEWYIKNMRTLEPM